MYIFLAWFTVMGLRGINVCVFILVGAASNIVKSLVASAQYIPHFSMWNYDSQVIS